VSVAALTEVDFLQIDVDAAGRALLYYAPPLMVPQLTGEIFVARLE
jgi:hypothetical protein